jgi:hypothetical protein
MIKPLERSDFDSWQQLWHRYLRFYRAKLPDQITTMTFERLMNQRHGFAGLVAEGHDSQLVGFAHLVFNPSTWSSDPYRYRGPTRSGRTPLPAAAPRARNRPAAKRRTRREEEEYE